MFRIRNIVLHKGIAKKEYKFTDTSYIYGHNNVGKTAFTKVIDYVLGSSERLLHEGLDNIEAVSAYLVNDKTELWVKRTVKGEYYYKRTETSQYTLVSLETYKDHISELITDTPDDKAVKVYQKVFEENLTYRSFTFLNFVDEIGQGDLGAIFTRGKETKHFYRVRDIMDFFFNYENIEKIYEKGVELEGIESERKQLNESESQYKHSITRIKNLFTLLDLPYSDDMQENYSVFNDFKNNFSRKTVKSNDDLVYLTKASHSLSEEIKLYSYLKNQAQEADSRKTRTERLLSTLYAIIAENDEYETDVKAITKTIEEIDQDKLILSLADYDASIKKIKEKKEDIDGKIAFLRSQSSELDYDKTIKLCALLEDNFSTIDTAADFNRAIQLDERAKALKKEIKDLKNSYSQKGINDFNERLTKMYLESNVTGVSYLDEDRKEEGFSLAFYPFNQMLVAKHKEGNVIGPYTPGSMARHNHLQLLVYLCMLEYLHKNFSNFIYLPILVIDSADQPMEDKSFEEIYPSLVEIARNVGVQTIFISKYKPESVQESDLIDITGGFNPFHQQNAEVSKERT